MSSVYAPGTAPEDLVLKYCKDSKSSAKPSYAPPVVAGTVSAVVANIAAPFYLYTQFKGKSDVWDRLLANTPEELLRAPTLDVGCGRGLVLLKIAQRKKALAASDNGGDVAKAYGIGSFGLGDDAATKTTANVDALDVAPWVVLHDASYDHAYPFMDNSFGLVTLSTVLHCAQGATKRKAIVKEMARVCRPGGKIMVLDLVGYMGGAKAALVEEGWLEKDIVLSMAAPEVMYGMWPGQTLVATKPQKA